MRDKSRADRLNSLLRSKTKVVNGFELRIFGLTLIAIAPLISVQPLKLDAMTITLIIAGGVLFVAGFLKKKAMRELPFSQAAVLMVAAGGLLLAMLMY